MDRFTLDHLVELLSSEHAFSERADVRLVDVATAIDVCQDACVRTAMYRAAARVPQKCTQSATEVGTDWIRRGRRLLWQATEGGTRRIARATDAPQTSRPPHAQEPDEPKLSKAARMRSSEV